MNKQDLLRRLAPCGIDCSRCVQYAEGPAARASRELQRALAGFERMAENMAKMDPAFAGYGLFSELLAKFAAAACPGCRTGGGAFPLCSARSCFKEQQVDFCFQCGEYPCSRNRYPEQLALRWRAANNRMKEIGPEAYYLEQAEKPRY